MKSKYFFKRSTIKIFLISFLIVIIIILLFIINIFQNEFHVISFTYAANISFRFYFLSKKNLRFIQNLNAIIPNYSIPINPRILLNQTYNPKITQQNETLSRSTLSAPLSAYTPTVPRFYLHPRTPRVSCPRSSPPLRLRGLGELIVGVVYVTPEPSGRVECTSVIVTYPHRG